MYTLRKVESLQQAVIFTGISRFHLISAEIWRVRSLSLKASAARDIFTPGVIVFFDATEAGEAGAMLERLDDVGDNSF